MTNTIIKINYKNYSERIVVKNYQDAKQVAQIIQTDSDFQTIETVKFGSELKYKFSIDRATGAINLQEGFKNKWGEWESELTIIGNRYEA